MKTIKRTAYTTITLLLLSSLATGAEIRFGLADGRCTLRATAEPDIGNWNETSLGSDGGRATSSGGYEISLERTLRHGHAVWQVKLTREDGQRFRVRDWSYESRTPLGQVATVFDTQAHTSDSIFRQAPQIDAAIDVRPNRGIPFMIACDHYGNNAMAVGAMDQTGTYRITGRRVDQEYGITIERREYPGDGWFTGDAFEDALFLSTEPAFWFDTAREFTGAVDRFAGYMRRPIHAKANEPYYSTWYAFANKIDQNLVLEQARLAREIGCGNFLIFIGWSECEDWFSSENAWGDYAPCEPKFADFAGMIRQMQQDLEMAVEVWVAPTWIGESSRSFESMKDYRSKWPGGGYDRNLDPRSPAARTHIRERFAALARNYGLDGFYVDFADTLWNRNEADHPMQPAHFGSAYEMFLSEMFDGFTSVQERPVAEYRVPFANLLSKRYATVFNTTYTDGDWNKSRLIAMGNRPFSNGVITRCDPLLWGDHEFDDRDAVGKAISAMIMLGPPGVSMDLVKLKADQRERLGRWFAFYREHRENLTQGEFRPFGEEYQYPEMMIHRGETAYAWISRWETGTIPLPEGTRHAFLFTALPVDVSFIARIHPHRVTGLEPGRYRARWFDSSMESHDGWFEMRIEPAKPEDPGHAGGGLPPLRTPRENWDFHPGEEGVPSLDVRRGGFLELQWLGK